MRVPVTKTLSSLYLDPPRDAPDNGIPELLPSSGSCPCGIAVTTSAVWAGADHGRSSMPLLPPPAARLSLCIDFPGYLQAQQHSPHQSALTLPPLSLRRKAPAMLLSALYPSAAEPSGDPRANLPAQDSALPPGFSLGSLAGGAIADGGDNGRRKRESSSSTVGGKSHGGRESSRASVDAAAAAEILSSWEHGQCPPLMTYGPFLPQPQVAAVAMDGPGDAVGEKLEADNIAGHLLQTLQLAAAMTAEPLPEPWVSPPSRPPPDSPEVAISQSQVPVQIEWSFDSDIQRARTQARHAAMDALGEIRYEHIDDSGCSSKDGGAGGHGSQAWGCFGGGGARLYSSGNGKSNGGAAAGSNDNVATGSSGREEWRRRPGGKGVALLLLSAFRCKTLRAVAVDGRKQHKYDRAACDSGIGTVLHCKASSGYRLGASNRGGSECVSDSHADVDENDEEEKEDGEEALLVLRSRDSRLVHRVRLAMDVSRGPAAVRRSVSSRSSPKAQDAAAAPTSVATDDLDAVMATAAATFTTATSEERPALSGPQPPLTAETVACRAAGQRRVWFRCPLVDRIHWFTRCHDTNSGSSNYGEDSDGKNLGKVRFEWLDLKGSGSRCRDTAASGSSYSNCMGRPTHARSESLTALLRRRSLSLLSLAGKLMASGRSLEAEPAEAAVDLSRRSVNPCVLAARGVW
ncbi:hypothetical protein Vretimale_8618 [Volvox reticuliferus]|uniref:Uncharacterized protein n=1 Tax=Volvox reticuliferus TaxID=1737510 RepID=A0A8J4LMW8_9CHLO|nr:hypothetical protein Vretifemale_6459 [Volvox reticuliferus]GIM03981.1 hypothetical protein Vretimale_8618 [Volvox reticuliferus]